MLRILARRLAAAATTLVSLALPPALHAQKALVYCPVGIDATGCNAIAAALTADATLFPDGVDAAYDGTSSTVDLAGADLSAYTALVIPSLADGPDAQPYSLLRNATIAGRIRDAFMGRTAVWSGTPDRGSTNRTAKDELIRNLARWAKADAAGTHGPGLVVLQDNSDDAAARYNWMAGLSALAVAPDTTLDVYSNVQVLTSTGRTILTNSGGLQIGYTNMASYGLAGGAGTSSDATGGHSGRVVLVTTQGEPASDGIATVLTDREDYFPPDTVIVSGAGWQPGETVALLFQQDVNPSASVTLSTVADDAGHIFNQQFVIDSAHIGARFTLTATGQTSGLAAQATFTDATGLNSVTMLGAQTPNPIAPGGSATYGTVATNSVQVRFNGNGSCTVTMTATGLPTGASATFAPTTLTGTSSGNMFTLLTVNTNAATTPTGTTNFTVRATGTGGSGNDCTTATQQTAAATLVVKRPTTTNVTGPASSSFGQTVNFSATVTGVGGTPTGTVQFKDAGVNLGTAQTLSGGSASLSTSSLTVGSHSITADYSGDGNYAASTSAALTHTVGKADQTISFTSTAPAAAVVGGATYTAAATATSGLTVSFTSQTPLVCTSSGTNGVTFSFIAAGTCIVAADQVGNGNFNAAPQVTQSFSVGKGSQTITFTSTAPVGATIGAPTYTVTATGGASGNAVTFSTLTAACTSSGTNGSTISFVAAGTCTVAADQLGNANYNAATQATQTFTVGKASQTISFDLSTLPPKTFGDPDFSVATPIAYASASSGLPVSFSSGSPTRCSVSSAGLVHIITAVGNCMVIASQGGNAIYNAAADVQQNINVAKGTQTITFTSTAPVGATVGGPTYTATATGGASGNPVTFSSLTTGVCTSGGTNGAVISFVGSGTCTVAANQLGNNDYNVATQVTQSFSVSAQAPQTISFTSTAPSNAVFGGTYLVSATATSGLTVVFSSLVTGVCTVAGSTVSFVGIGTCTVAANQPGNASFFAAPEVTQAFAVGQADQLITFATLANKTYGNADFGGSATASSSLAVTFTASGQCTVSTATVHLTGAGSCTITAHQAGNANYHAAPDVPRNFTINQAPVAPLISVANKTYDGTDAASIVTRDLSGVIGSDDVSLIDGTAAFANRIVGTGKSVTGSGFSLAGTASGNYVLDPTTATATANIKALEITITATTDSREYDGTANSSALPTVPSGSIQTGDHAAFTQQFDNKNVGTGKTLTPAGAVDDGNGGNNYIVHFVPVTTGEITAKALTGHITAENRPYDGSDAAVILTRTLTGVIGTENVSYVGGTATFDSRNAGIGKTVTATGLGLAGSDAGNYTVNETASTTANIDQLPITVTAVSDTKTYDGTTTSDGIPTVSGNSIIAPDLGNFTQAFDNKNAGSGKTLNPAGAVNDGNGGQNYDVHFVSVSTGKIERRGLTVSATVTPKTYDGNTDAVVTLSDDRVTDDVLTLDYSHPAHFDTKNAGSGKTVAVDGITVGGADADNYTANTTATATGTILRRKITVTAATDTREYNGGTGSSGVPTVTYGTLVSGETPTWTQTFDSKHAGSRTLTPAGSVADGNGGLNYDVTFKTANGSISTRGLTPLAAGQNKVYDATDAATVSLGDDRLVGDLFTLDYSHPAHFDDKNVGNGKTVSVSGIVVVAASGPEAGDYHLTITTASTTANIGKAPLVVSATGVNKIFDGNTSASATLSATPLLSDVVAPLSYANASFATASPGLNKPMTVIGISLGGADAGNYAYNTTAATTANITYFTGSGHMFLQPVNLPPQQRSAFKINSTIPIKFQIFLADGVTPVPGVIASISTLKLSSSAPDGVNEDVVSTVPDQGTSFRYDPVGKLYIFNLGTKAWSTGTYRVIATLDDGSTITADVEARSK